MDSVVIAAIITSIGAIVSAIIIVNKEKIIALLRRSNRDWSGIWKGVVTSNDTAVEYSVLAKLSQRGNIIKGTISSHNPEILEYSIEGEVIEPEFMTYFAINSDKNALNYLIGINRFDRGANEMIGCYLARSRIVEGIGSGNIKLEKLNK